MFKRHRFLALRNLSLICLACIGPQGVSASPLDPAPDKQVAIIGAGGTNCSDYLSNPEMARTQLEWAFGYISAVNAYVWPDGRLHGDLDAVSIKARLTAICSKDPKADFLTAVTRLLFQFEERAAAGRSG